MVDESLLALLVRISNERFETNKLRIDRFRDNVMRGLQSTKAAEREDPEKRRERKRLEGLARQRALRAESLEEGVKKTLPDESILPNPLAQNALHVHQDVP